MIEKYKERKIVKKCHRGIYLLAVSRDKCNNGIKRENTESLPIIICKFVICNLIYLHLDKYLFSSV